MIVARLVLGRVLGWSALAALLLGGMAALAGAVESAGLGAAGAVLVALASAPAVLVALAPTIAAAGAAAAAGRTEALGERLTLDIAGVHPARAVLVAVFGGLLLGGGQWAASDHLVWRLEAQRQAALGQAPPGWVWLEDGALRPSDGTWVGRDLTVALGRTVGEGSLAAARMRQQPRTASGAVLRDTGLESARLERHSRRARAVACGALAGIAWLPLGAAAGLGRVGAVLALALAWQATDAALYAASAQGRLDGLAGGWAAAAVACVLLGAGLARLR